MYICTYSMYSTVHTVWYSMVQYSTVCFSSTPKHRLKTEEDSDDSDTDSEDDGVESKGKETVKGIEMKQVNKQKVQVSDKDTKDVLLYRDPTHVALALKVVEQMCNGQNSMLQVIDVIISIHVPAVDFILHYCVSRTSSVTSQIA